MRASMILIAALFTFSASTAFAQDDAPPPETETTPEPPPEPKEVEPAPKTKPLEPAKPDPKEETLFKEAFEALKDNEWQKGADLMDSYLKLWPKGAFAKEALALRELAVHLEAKAKLDPKPVKRKGPSKKGRTELVIYSSTFGVWLGIAGGILADFDEGILLSSAVGGGAGLAISLVLTSGGGEITEGQAALVSTVGTWATWNGAALSLIGDLDAKPAVGTTALIGSLGVIAAAATMRTIDPDPGDVSLVGSGGTWGTFLAGMGLLIAQPDIGPEGFVGVLVAGSDIGLVTMALLTPQIDISRSRARFIDLGGLLGTLTTGGVALAIKLDDPTAVGVTLTLGAGLGIGLATILTDDWDDKKKAEEKAEAFDLHTPTPFVIPHRGKDGQTGLAAGLNVFQGTF